ncbi:MAG: glycosyltransferase family 4 protein [Methanosarcinales archaeon]|nr:glycosyltransferase family 4 protein [Methanosarcinales archaeon]
MNICIFTPGWLPVHRDFGAGGIEVHVQQLVSGIIRKGHEITIITTKHPEDVKYEELDGLNIFYAGNYPLKCNSDYYKESIELFNEINKTSQFDIVHTQDYAGYGYYKKYDQKIPSVVTAHGTPLNMLKSISRVKNPKSFPQVPHWVKYHLFVSPVIFRKSNKIISVSDELCNDIIFQYNISKSKITTVFHGIDTELFKPKLSNVKTEIDIKNEKLILFVGGLQKLKGVHLLIESLPQILTRIDAKLVIIGDGPYLNNLKKTVNRINVRNKVIFIEKVSNQALPDYYNAADIVVIPSIVIESAGLVVLESMSTGRPVIASKIGGIPSAIEHLKDGILVEPGNTRELSERIFELLQNKELAENLGRAGRNKVIEKFSLDRMIEQTLRIYEECIN